MAFFGLTHLGYQNPIGEKILLNPREPSTSKDSISNVMAGISPSVQEQPGSFRCAEECQIFHPPLAYSSDIHHGSHKQYKEIVNQCQTPRSPNQLYKMPLTDNQQYGWMASKKPEPWMQVRRFPRKNSEMTKFANEMSLADRDFSQF